MPPPILPRRRPFGTRAPFSRVLCSSLVASLVIPSRSISLIRFVRFQSSFACMPFMMNGNMRACEMDNQIKRIIYQVLDLRINRLVQFRGSISRLLILFSSFQGEADILLPIIE